MCHESSGVGLGATIGVGKGTVTLDDIEQADLILVVGQNPGTNHPRMLTALELAKRGGTKIVAINPLPEAGLIRFRNPQTPRGPQRAGHRAGRPLPAGAGRRRHGAVPAPQPPAARGRRDRRGLPRAPHHRSGGPGPPPAPAGAFRAARGHRAGRRRTSIGWSRWPPRPSARSSAGRWGSPSTRRRWPRSRRSSTSCCCAAASASRAPGPARSAGTATSRATGRWASTRSRATSSSTGWRRSSASIRPASTATTRSTPSGRCATARSTCSSRWAATSWPPRPTPTRPPRPSPGAGSPCRCRRSSTGPTCSAGEAALILPCLGRTERDVTGGHQQFVSVEDSMGMVHATSGGNPPASEHLRSEVDIVCAARPGDARRPPRHRLGRHGPRLRPHPRPHAAVVPGFDDFNARVREPGGFTLPNAARDSRTFATASGKAELTVNTFEPIEVPEGRLLLQTVRSHDQYNTTIYGLDDRYRGISQGRRVVFVRPDDIADARAGRRRGGRHRQRVARRHRAAGAVVPGGRLPRRRRHAARPTSRRPTCSCRSTAPPTAAAPPPRSRSSSASTPSEGRAWRSASPVLQISEYCRRAWGNRS